MRFDMSQTLSADFIIPPATLAADNTPATFAMGNFDSLTVYIQVGVGGITFSGTNKIEFVMTHSDDDVTFTNVAAADLVGVASVTGGIVRALVAAHAAPSATEIGYIGNKPFLRMLADFSGTHGTGTPISVLGVRGRPLRAPV